MYVYTRKYLQAHPHRSRLRLRHHRAHRHRQPSQEDFARSSWLDAKCRTPAAGLGPRLAVFHWTTKT